jgi:hypothetical protein
MHLGCLAPASCVPIVNLLAYSASVQLLCMQHHHHAYHSGTASCHTFQLLSCAVACCAVFAAGPDQVGTASCYTCYTISLLCCAVPCCAVLSACLLQGQTKLALYGLLLHLLHRFTAVLCCSHAVLWCDVLHLLQGQTKLALYGLLLHLSHRFTAVLRCCHAVTYCVSCRARPSWRCMAFCYTCHTASLLCCAVVMLSRTVSFAGADQAGAVRPWKREGRAPGAAVPDTWLRAVVSFG